MFAGQLGMTQARVKEVDGGVGIGVGFGAGLQLAGVEDFEEFGDVVSD